MVLDIGAGSGLHGVMLAQRTGHDVQVDAVELDEGGSRSGAGKMPSRHRGLRAAESARPISIGGSRRKPDAMN